MNAREAALAARLNAAAARVPVQPDLERVLNPPVGNTAVATRPRHPRRRIAVAAAVSVVCIAGVLLSGASRSTVVDVGSSDGGSCGPAEDATGSGPEPGSMLPLVWEAPGWVGGFEPATRAGAIREGRWVSAAFAKPGPNRSWQQPVVVSAFLGSHQAQVEATPRVVNGRALDSVSINGWNAVFWGQAPTVMASGTVEFEVLEAFVSATRTGGAGDPSLCVDSLPASYQEVVAPQRLGEDSTPRSTLYSSVANLTINEVSDLTSAALAAALTGADLTPVAVGDGAGWSGQTASSGSGPLTFLTWSPEPGVVFEITTVTDHNADRLAEIAAQVAATPAPLWADTLAWTARPATYADVAGRSFDVVGLYFSTKDPPTPFGGSVPLFTARVTFGDDGTLTASAGCHALSGRYEQSGDTFEVLDLTLSTPSCLDGSNDFAERLYNALVSGVATVANDQLRLTTDGRTTFTLAPA